jgi:hypothetical protein
VHIRKADIVPILQILAHQKCDYTLLRPETLVEQPSSYRDIDLCMPPEVAPEFIRYLTAYASARGARVETRELEPFAIDVTITQDHVPPIKVDIHTRVTWRGFPVFNYADILATAVPRNGIKHVDKQRGDVVTFVKDLFGRGRLDRKDRWWPEFICQVRAAPNIYNAILVKHVFMFLTDSLIDRIQRGDRLWIENRKLLLQAVFIATQLSRRPFTSIVGHLQWWIVKIRQRTQTQ